MRERRPRVSTCALRLKTEREPKETCANTSELRVGIENKSASAVLVLYRTNIVTLSPGTTQGDSKEESRKGKRREAKSEKRKESKCLSESVCSEGQARRQGMMLQTIKTSGSPFCTSKNSHGTASANCSAAGQHSHRPLTKGCRQPHAHSSLPYLRPGNVLAL